MRQHKISASSSEKMNLAHNTCSVTLDGDLANRSFGSGLSWVKFGSLKFCLDLGSVRIKFGLIEFGFGSG